MAPVLAAACVASGLASACASSTPPAPTQAVEPADRDAVLRVELVFGADADLDLYVTDPAQETVYFANSPSQLGGALAEDLRCDAPSPRVERVTFERPPAGRYRVGVDFPERCSRLVDEAGFRIVVDGAGTRRERAGTLAFGRFEPIALEFEVHGRAGAE